MKKRIIALAAVLTLLMAFFAGCSNTGTKNPGGNPSGNSVNEAQLVVAINPLLVYNRTETVVAYNDVMAAMATDSQNSSMAAISQSPWQWRTQKSDDSWMQRATYDWGKWTSGSGAQVKGLFAYSFNAAGNLSLALYNAKNAQLTAYGADTAADAGLLVSVTGSQEEALTYVAQQDGVITIPAGTLTAISAVNGVKTGFLAEDGTPRSASVRLMVNSAQVWSGTLQNSTAATDGTAVTQLSYPQIDDLHVKAGDVVYFSFQLDAQANADEDVTAPTINEDDNWAVTKKSKRVKVEKTDKDEVNTEVVLKDGSIRLITDYEFTFTLVRDHNDTALVSMVAKMASELMTNTGAVIPVAKADHEEVPYEIIVGAHKDRPKSLELTKELKNFRSDNITDYRIKLDGTKVYIVGANNQALQLAVDYFIKTFGMTDKGKIPENYDYIHRPEHKTVMLAGKNIANYIIRTERNPSLIIQRAAEALQEYVVNNCGYSLEIRIMNVAGNDHVDNEIQIGPMNGSVTVDRALDTKFDYTTEKSVGKVSIDADGYIVGDYGYYKTAFSGKNLVFTGGSAYAVNVAVNRLLAILDKNSKLDANFTDSGSYTSSFDYFNGGHYDTVKYDMTDGYGLVLSDEFNFETNHEETEKSVRSRWTLSSDRSKSCSSDAENKKLTEWQWRPGVYGEHWWITQDTEANGYLVEITKRAYRENKDLTPGTILPGYDAVRLVSEDRFGWRYGISETRLVMGTRNGACSAVWYANYSGYPGTKVSGVDNEFDLYENYGRELLVPNSYAFYNGVENIGYKLGASLGWVEPRKGEHFYDTFHHITMEWTYDMVRYYLDGQPYCELPLNDNDKHRAFRTGTTWKLANGVGGPGYTALLPDMSHAGPTYDPVDFLGEENLDKFFEVQLVDYVRLYQTSNKGKGTAQKNEFVYTNFYNHYHNPNL